MIVTGPDQPRPPDLSFAREQVLAIVAGSAMGRRAPAVDAVAALRPPATAGSVSLQKQPTAPPHIWGRIVVPCAIFAVLDLVGVVVAVRSGNLVLAVLAGVLFVPFAAAAIVGAKVAKGLTAQPGSASGPRAVNAGRWRSRQSWTGPLASGPERGLVIAAADAVGRIANSHGYRPGALDLGAELDHIDIQAYRIALARQTAGPHEPPGVAAAWTAAVDRAAALTAYANQLDGLQARTEEMFARNRETLREGGLDSTLSLGDVGEDELLALSIFLQANWPYPDL